jgi:phosphohistidine swiveling domain-containing protein
MMRDGLIDKTQALMRIQPELLEQLLFPRLDPKAGAKPVAKGLPASPGAASGIAVFDADRAEKLGRAGEKVILVREETKPEDIHGFFASQGILTSRGGKTSHAAVVARGMGTPCVAGAPALTFIKRRPVIDRFANYNSSVSLTTPDRVFSPEELDSIGRFCAAMRLDWGGLDILRDRVDGRLYIVDVNKTDMPPLRLPWLDKMRAVARLGAALNALIKTASARDRS